MQSACWAANLSAPRMCGNWTESVFDEGFAPILSLHNQTRAPVSSSPSSGPSSIALLLLRLLFLITFHLNVHPHSLNLLLLLLLVLLKYRNQLQLVWPRKESKQSIKLIRTLVVRQVSNIKEILKAAFWSPPVCWDFRRKLPRRHLSLWRPNR